MYEVIAKNGHYEAYRNGEFCFSADSEKEVYEEVYEEEGEDYQVFGQVSFTRC